MYPWFHSTEKLITQSRSADRLAHGLLIDAPEGSGKIDFAISISQWVLCSNHKEDEIKACGQCKSCQVFAASTHPDFYLLDRLVDNKGKSKQSIGIDQVRELTQKLSSVAQLSGWRVAIIRSVSDLTTASFNALLKTLEEPGHKTLLILLADNLQKVPATVKSRCQIIKPELKVENLKEWLVAQTDDISNTELELILSESNYAPLLALKMIEDDYLSEREQMFQLMDRLLECQETPQSTIDSIEIGAKTWKLVALYFHQLARRILRKETLGGNFAKLEAQVVFELYDQIMSYQKAQFAGSNLQEKLQLQAILIKWYEAGRKIIHFSKA